MLKFIKKNILIIAMLAGALSYRVTYMLAPYTPLLIFLMLFLTFCKLSPKDLKLRPFHYCLVAVQVLGSIGAYCLLRGINTTLAEGALICILTPTATSAPVITGMLGGSISLLTTYSLLCNVTVAVVAPAIFAQLGNNAALSFGESFWIICSKIGPLLLLPLIAAWLLRVFSPKIHQKIISIHQTSFYLWVTALVIVTGNTVDFLVHQQDPDYWLEAGLAAVALVICLAQFLGGRRLGRYGGDPVSVGQSLGQKNTILSIWMAQTYLNPLASVAPAAYLVWQNLVNSYQLYLHSKGKALPF